MAIQHLQVQQRRVKQQIPENQLQADFKNAAEMKQYLEDNNSIKLDCNNLDVTDLFIFQTFFFFKCLVQTTSSFTDLKIKSLSRISKKYDLNHVKKCDSKSYGKINELVLIIISILIKLGLLLRQYMIVWILNMDETKKSQQEMLLFRYLNKNLLTKEILK